ncbi:NADH dehydrogenase [Epithele typhae]|uniref:NADH dehydrogenase n=1 Tax=Epithele typhae TaxID=378194 RepID=UPI002008E6BE|nr:NADH dehydrogenase [Epithele typhae]KAH9933238.1 NADH dehydrogenase [Epithele typhae]
MLAISSKAVRLPRALTHSKRALHDLTILPSGKAAVQQGPPGVARFLGRYVVAKLAKAGSQVIIPYRDEDEKRHLKVLGDLGQIVPLEWDLRRPDQIEECLRHSDTVYNLVGRDYETSNYSYDDVHVRGASDIASIAAQNGVDKFVHVSHLNASHDSPSAFYRSKAMGEERVKDAFPTAMIVRPATMFGAEDKFLNNMAIWPIWWKLNHMQTKVRPAHVLDVAQALANTFTMAPIPGTFNLPGPSTLTYDYLLALVSTITYNPVSGAPTMPKRVALALSSLAQNVWWPLISPDEVERRYIDDATVPGDWATFGVVPDEIEEHAITYLRRYRSADNFSRPVVFPASRETSSVSPPACPPC